MDTDSEKLAASANTYYYGLIISAILGVILLIAVIYFGYERSKMDVTINNMVNPADAADETQPADADTIVELLEKGYLRAVSFVVIVGIAVGTVAVAYLSYSVGALSGALSATGVALLAAAAGMVYVLVRVLEATMNLTTTTATNHPAFVYESVRSIEHLFTATLALLAFYAGVTFLSYLGARRITPAAPAGAPYGSSYSPAGAAGADRVAGAGRVPGGFVNYHALGATRSAAVRGPSAAAPARTPGAFQ